ncbi:MAG: secretin N-terminal domain-containing protein [Chthoniobacterales bacterium]
MIPSTHRTASRGLLIATLLLLSLAGLTAQQEPAPSKEEPVTIQFPRTSVAEVLTVYEKLTGKRLIRDSNLAGPELSIMVTDPVPPKEAVALIESSLLLNGYTLVPVDEKTVKILGPSRPPRSEGLPLYLQESELPQEGDKIVSFYQPLRFLSPSEALSIVQGVVQLNAYGSLVAVPNTSALVITEKTPIIRKAIALLQVVDREPSQIITEFIPLQRANAEKVVETLNQMFGAGSGGGSASPPPQGGQGGQQQGAVVSTGGDIRLLSGKAQFIAEKRTNRVLMIVKAENYKYLRELISKLDQPVETDQPLIRPLNYISVGDLFPVLVDMLKGKDDKDSKDSTSGNARSQPTPQNQQQGNSAGAGGSSTGGAVANTPDKLTDAAAQNPPQSATIGATSIIGDSSGNSIIVYGPPDSKAKAAQIIDLLDRRPKQVYLAAVIGQMELNDDLEYGASWFAKINTGGTNNLIGAAVNGSIANVLTNLVTSGLTNAINSFPSSLTGLTVYGAIAQGVSTYARALESTGKFRVLSRPVVYTSNNKKAVIFNGQNVPVPSQTQSTSLAGGNQLGNTIQANITYIPAVLKLEVIPLINADKEVNLVIAQQNNRVGNYQNVGGVQAPTILTQELTTTVRVPSGATIVLGGLIQDDKTLDDRGIPILDRIPVIGALAGGLSRKQRIRRELVVMIQPIVVESNDAMEKASLEQGGDSDLGQRARTLKEKLRPTPTPTPKKKKFQLFPQKKIDNF